MKDSIADKITEFCAVALVPIWLLMAFFLMLALSSVAIRLINEAFNCSQS